MKKPMRQYEVVLVKLAGRTRPDEESLTDLLNERARTGWQFHTVAPLSPARVLVVFARDTA
jgi:Domain of unknown function (DUF4177)